MKESRVLNDVVVKIDDRSRIVVPKRFRDYFPVPSDELHYELFSAEDVSGIPSVKLILATHTNYLKLNEHYFSIGCEMPEMHELPTLDKRGRLFLGDFRDHILGCSIDDKVVVMGIGEKLSIYSEPGFDQVYRKLSEPVLPLAIGIGSPPGRLYQHSGHH